MKRQEDIGTLSRSRSNCKRVFQVTKCEPLILLDEMNVGSVSRLNRPSVPSKAEREPSLVFAGSLCVFRYLPETNSSQRNQRSTLSEGYPFKINELQQNTQHPLIWIPPFLQFGRFCPEPCELVRSLRVNAPSSRPYIPSQGRRIGESSCFAVVAG